MAWQDKAHCQAFNAGICSRWFLGAVLASVLVIFGHTALAAGSAPALQADEERLDSESRVVQRILKRATHAEQNRADAQEQILAAHLYCLASQLGSVDAQYRLGRLLLEGRGTRQSTDKAATLFSMAAGKGHIGATIMMRKIGVRKIALPGCLKIPDENLGSEGQGSAHSLLIVATS